jgi:hypothetical protein
MSPCTRGPGDDGLLLLVIVGVVSGGEERCRHRVLLVFLATVHRRARGVARPTAGGALATVCVVRELAPPVFPPVDAALARALRPIPFPPLRLRAENRGPQRRVSAGRTTASPRRASAASHGEVAVEPSGAGGAAISRRRRWRKAAAAAEGSRVWKPNSPPRTVLIRGEPRISRGPELSLRARPRVLLSPKPVNSPEKYGSGRLFDLC